MTEGLRLTYQYSPGRFPQRQHCFSLDFGDASFSGYGSSRLRALRDLKDEMKNSPHLGNLDTLYQDWLRKQ